MKVPPKTFLTYCKLAVTAVLLGWLVNHLEPSSIYTSVLETEPLWLAAALVVGVPGFCVQWLKWHQLLRSRVDGIDPSNSLQSLFIGYAFGILSPGRLGELGRGMFLGHDRMEMLVLAVLDRSTAFAATTLLAGIGLVVIAPGCGLLWLGIWAAALAALLCFAAKFGSLLGRVWGGERVSNIVAEIPGSQWTRMTIWSLVFQLAVCAQYYLLLRSWGTFELTVLAGIPLIFGIKTLLPIGIMDIGVREAAAVFVFEFMELDPVPAFGAAIVLFAINVLIPALVGSAILLHRFLGISQRSYVQ